MRPYLPRDGMASSPYSEGGALYALGLMYSNYDPANKAFLLQSLRDSSSEVGPCQASGLPPKVHLKGCSAVCLA